MNKFVFEVDVFNILCIFDVEILGVIVVLLICVYDGCEFVCVGYYVNNEYDLEELNVELLVKFIIDCVRCNIFLEKFCVICFVIKWYEFCLCYY